jgi:hypothetical protein
MKSSKVIIHLFGRISGNVFSNFSHLNSFLVSQLNVLIFVTYLVIVSIVSAQEVDDKDLELSETKFKKYYIQRHDSGHGGCDDGT